MSARRFYEFGAFRLDPAGRLLFRDGKMLPLAPKAVETLLVLVENWGGVVEKDELLKRVWRDTFVEEGSLARNISVLRKVLGDNPEGHEFIVTIPKRGYRFVKAVREISESSPAQAEETEKQEVASAQASPPEYFPGPEAPGLRWRRRYKAIGALGVIVALLPTAYIVRYHFWPPSVYSGRRIMLAVLPVQNLSGDPDWDYVSDGLTEEMISQLGSMNPQRLGVIARTSSMTYKITSKAVDQIGRELGVDYVLETSIRGTNDHLRVTAQLIRTSDQTHLWAHDYDRTVRDIVALQDDVAQAVVAEIHPEITPQQLRRPSAAGSTNPEAYDDFLRGRYFWNERTQQGFLRARSYFEQAIEKDPGSPRSYAGLADTYIGLSEYDVLPAKEAIPRAKAAAMKAIELDGTLAEPHTALANVLCEFDWDVTAAEGEFTRAIELNPSYATAHQWYGECLLWIGRNAEAERELNRAKQLDPLSPIMTRNAGLPLFLERRYDEFIEFSHKVLVIDPDFWGNHFSLAWAYEQKKDFPQAIAEYETANRINETSLGLAHLAHAYAASGRKGDAQKLLDTLLLKSKQHYIPSAHIAIVYEGLGDKDAAFQWLTKAYDERYWWMIALKSDPRWNSLRSDPRFQDLMRRIGLTL